MRRRYYSGVIEAIGDTQGLRGLERFSVSVTPDGSRTLHATCEIYDRNVSRDVIYSVDRDFRPMDACVRLIKDGSLLGTGGFASFDPHPLSCDIWYLARYDHASKQRIQYFDSALSSLEHDGCSGPMLHQIRFGIESLGPQMVTVPAGTFETHHYQFHLDGSLPEEHPLEQLWCIPGDFIFVKIRVDGYMSTTYHLTELVR